MGSSKVGRLQWLEFVVELPCGAWYMRNDGAYMWMLCKFDDLGLVVVVVDVVVLWVGYFVNFDDMIHRCGCGGL